MDRRRLIDAVAVRATPQRTLLLVLVVITGVVIAGIAVVLRELSHDTIRDQAFTEAERTARTLADFAFEADEFRDGHPTRESLADLADLLGETKTLSGLRVIDSSGTILFDSLGLRPGAHTELDDVAAPLAGEPFVEVTSTGAERTPDELVDNADAGEELVEVNLPIGIDRDTGGPLAVLAVYTPYGPIKHEIAETNRVNTLLLVGAGLLLFALLIPPIARISKRAGNSVDPDVFAIQRRLARAIELDHLVLHYQPKVSCATGLPTGVEALVRWQDPERGQIPPAEFIPAAERGDVIEKLTLKVVELACAQAAAWRRQGIDLPISINFSPRNLRDADLPTKLAGILSRYDVPAEQLVVEVTESAAMDEFEISRSVLERLSAMGFGISVDDFGTGHSSLGRLDALPLDELKIDRTFVVAAARDNNSAIVRAITSIAHEFGLRVIAEGVEDQATLERLAADNCDEVQGFFICRPIPADMLVAWIRARPILVGDERRPSQSLATRT
jgi:EAL domain-containing protein (putative c-di-GMP-specific phosphodiesterase class I)